MPCKEHLMPCKRNSRVRGTWESFGKGYSQATSKPIIEKLELFAQHILFTSICCQLCKFILFLFNCKTVKSLIWMACLDIQKLQTTKIVIWHSCQAEIWNFFSRITNLWYFLQTKSGCTHHFYISSLRELDFKYWYVVIVHFYYAYLVR